MKFLERSSRLGWLAAVPAIAGAAVLTDDPAPTGHGHWEIYGFTAGRGPPFDHR